jgi:hypothetical protein
VKGIAYLFLVLSFTLTAYALPQDDVIFYESFDDIPVGKTPEGWLITNVGKVEVAEFPSAIDKSLHIVDQFTGAGAKVTFAPQKAGVFSIEYRFLRVKGSSGDDVEIIYVIGSKGEQPFNGSDVAMHPGGAFNYNNGGAWQDGEKIEDDKWHLFKYEIELDGNKWNLFYDEQQVKSNIKFRGNIGGALDMMLIMNFVDGGTSFEAYLSEILIYKGTKRPALAVEKRGKLATVWGRIKLAPQMISPRHDLQQNY